MAIPSGTGDSAAAARILSSTLSLLFVAFALWLVQEISQFQNRLNRAMSECQDKARDMMKPGYENDAKQMAKVEDYLINCMSRTVDEYIKLLNPMKERIKVQLKK